MDCDFRDLITKGKITYSGENMLIRIVNCNNAVCLDHLEKNKLSRKEAVTFLERCRGLLDNRIQWLSGPEKCPDKL